MTHKDPIKTRPKPAREPIALTAELAREWFEYDAQTGNICAPVKRGKWESGRSIGTNKDGYVQVAFGGKQYRAHRVIWLMVHGAWPSGVIDHINGDRSDNRLINLRDLPQAINLHNMVKPSHNTSGLMGVSKSGRAGKPWYASISVGGRTLSLGRHATLEEAQRAYLDARRVHCPTQPIPRDVDLPGTTWRAPPGRMERPGA